MESEVQEGSAQPTPAAAANSEPAESKKLTPNQRLKEVLCTRLMISDDDADRICQEITHEN